jgi:ribosomal protein L35AE/L33A
MQLSRARELIEQQMAFTSGYNRNAVRMILGEVARVHGQAAVKPL